MTIPDFNQLIDQTLAALRGQKWCALATAAVCGFFVLYSDLLLWAGVLGFLIVVGVAIWPVEARRGQTVERVRVAKRRHAAKADLQAILDGMPFAAMILDTSQRVVLFNHSADDAFAGLEAGAPVAGVLRDPDFLASLSGVKRSDSGRTVVFQQRVPAERRIAATLAWLPNTGAKPARPGVLVTLQDLTERDLVARMRSDFISYASHELRTPLASLRGFIETLLGPARDDAEARQRFLGIMAGQAERMTRLIDDLLSLSRLEQRARLVPTDTVDVTEIVDHAVQVLAPLAEGSNITVDFTRPETAYWVRGDRDELVQVLQNLLQNAIRYGGDDGHVKVAIVHAEPAGGRRGGVAISVEDNGPGIAPEHLPRLVERFYRVDVNSSREKGGTGLGLAIVKHVINRHRGDLKIESVLGEGSKFTVTLPLIPSPA